MKKTPAPTRKILLVDDEQKFLNSIAERLRLLGFEPIKALSGEQALELAKETAIDLAIVDLKMPGMDGLVTITKLKELYPDLRSVLLTGHGNEKIRQATESLSTAYFEKDRMESFWDFIKKSNQGGNIIVIRPPEAGLSSGAEAEARAEIFEPGQIESASGGHDPRRQLSASARQRQEANREPADKLRMIGETPAMQELRTNIDRLAALDCPFIIRGETGTGKQLAARIIHHSSPRRRHRFIAINCGCFSNDVLIEELLRSTHLKLAEATQGRKLAGRYEAGGTILLDQIEDLSLTMQLSMLKIIDSKKVLPRESAGNFPVDVRIVAASQFSLGKLVEEGRFKKELYHRLNVFELQIPPLRERRDDIRPLCGYFTAKFAKEFDKAVEFVADEVIDLFMAYDFPGNVRELEHIVERAVILADGKTLRIRHLPERFQTPTAPPYDAHRKFTTLAEMEKNYILEVLEATGGNKSRAVELLGISRAALWRKLKQFEAEKKAK
jgi:two-component system response regulator AtoC